MFLGNSHQRNVNGFSGAMTLRRFTFKWIVIVNYSQVITYDEHPHTNDWLDRYKPFIEDGKTIVASPHKVYGPQTNDLVKATA